MILALFVLCKDEIVRWRRCSSLDEAVLMWVCWRWWFISYWVRCSFQLVVFEAWTYTIALQVFTHHSLPFSTYLYYVRYWFLTYFILFLPSSFFVVSSLLKGGLLTVPHFFTYPVVDSFDTFVTCYNLFVFLTMFIFLRSCLWRFTFTRWSYPLLWLLVVVL